MVALPFLGDFFPDYYRQKKARKIVNQENCQICETVGIIQCCG